MFWFLLGLAALVSGANLLVRGASRLALAVGISPLVVGLTVVAFGTSAPELAVSVGSAWAGRVDIALGNVVGSNVLNVLLILGVSALIVPLVVHQQVIRQEVPVMIGATLLLWAMAADGGIGRREGLLLFGLMVVYTVVLVWQSRRQGAAARAEAEAEHVKALHLPSGGWSVHWAAQWLFILAGLALLVIGARWIVEAAIGFARQLGVSDTVVGLTIVAAGTSLPEVAASIVAAIGGERDIAVGNIVGSNVFNILAVLGASASVAPADLAVAPALLAIDIPIMVAVALACLPIFFTGHLIARWEGGLFLGLYVAYTSYLILDATGHDAMDHLRTVMAGFILPLLVATVIVVVRRHLRANRR